MNFVEVHLNDYAAATFHLSPLEDGIYWRLLRCYYRDERPLPAELADVARMVGARTEAELKAVDVVLGEFFTLGPDGWRQARCDAELERYKGKSEAARESAKKRWHKPGDANAMPSHSEGNATHLPTTHLPTTQGNPPSPPGGAAPRKRAAPVQALEAADLAADGVSVDTALEFLALRKRHKAALTAKAWAGIKAEAAKVGWTCEQALQKCLARGWRGFEAAWVQRDLHGAGGMSPQQALEARNQRTVDELNAELQATGGGR